MAVAAGLKPIWKQPIGGGYASFVVAGGRAFTIEQRGANEVAAAYDLATGRELWTNAWAAAFREFMGGDGPRATPTWHDGLVYALGGEGELRCLDAATGRLVWRTNILADAGANNLQWGMAASPLIVDNTVVVLPGGPNGQSIVAYDRRSGKRVWGALDDQQSYSSPMLVTLGGVRQLLVFSATRLMGLTPDRGEVLWEHPWKTQADINASQPLVGGDESRVHFTGYGDGAAVLELTPARQSIRGTRSLAEHPDEEPVHQLGTAQRLHLWTRRIDSGVCGRGHGRLEVEGRAIRLRPGGAGQRPPDRSDRGWRPRAGQSDARPPRGNRPLLGVRRENVEASGVLRRLLLIRNISEMAAFDLRAPAR